MTPTTPSRSLDMAVEFPELADLARTTTRLHPYPGVPTIHDSSVGGPLLWPVDEPWPEYESRYRSHRPLTTLSDIRTLRAVLTQVWSRPRVPEQSAMTEAERDIVDRIHAGHAQELLPPGPLPLIPLAQLYARDVPGFSFPEGTDLLQVLWSPSDGIEGCSDAVQLRWRLSSDIREVLSTSPEPAYVENSELVPDPCLLRPEQVTEFPPNHLLDEELLERVLAWSEQTWSEGRLVNYGDNLSVAPGWKLGGWPAHFTFREPAESDELHCGVCGGPVQALLTVASSEWDAATGSWRPAGEGTHEPAEHPYRSTREPTMITIGRGYTLQFYSCLSTPSHLPRTIMQ